MKMTYRGYIKFLETDRAHKQSRIGCSRKSVKRLNGVIAKKMIIRGTVSYPKSQLVVG